MPRYGYLCQDCQKRFRLFLSYEQYDQGDVQCPYCQSRKLSQLLNRVRFARSGESMLENMDGMDDLSGLEDDPRAMGKMMRAMSREAGEDLGPEFDEVVSRLEKGQSPEEIEAAMPELGEGAAGMPGGGLPGGSLGADFGEDF